VEDQVVLAFWLLGVVEVVSREGLLGVLVAQDYLVLLHVLDFCVFGDAFLVVGVVVFYSLSGAGGTSGRKGAGIFLISSLYQSILLKKG
jgi:hypothetical protein